MYTELIYLHMNLDGYTPHSPEILTAVVSFQVV